MKGIIFIAILVGISYCYAANQEEKSEEAESQNRMKYIPHPGLHSPYHRGHEGHKKIRELEFILGHRGDRPYRLGHLFHTGQVTYVRWGKTACPCVIGTKLLYKGRAAGGNYTNSGGGSELLCLPENPEFLVSKAGGNRAYLTNTEYETNTGPSFQNLHDQDVPCVTCLSTMRGTKIMIPGKVTCLQGWTREYYGYLMTSFYNHAGRLQYYCVDVSAEAVPGTSKNINGALLYHVEVHTRSLPSAYTNGNEMACVVCTT